MVLLMEDSARNELNLNLRLLYLIFDKIFKKFLNFLNKTLKFLIFEESLKFL